MSTITAVHLVTSLIFVQQIQTRCKELSFEKSVFIVETDIRNNSLDLYLDDWKKKKRVVETISSDDMKHPPGQTWRRWVLIGSGPLYDRYIDSTPTIYLPHMPGLGASGVKNVKHVFTVHCEEKRWDAHLLTVERNDDGCLPHGTSWGTVYVPVHGGRGLGVECVNCVMSPSEGQLHAFSQDLQNRHQRSRDYGLAPDKLSHNRDQHQPPESLSRLLAGEQKDNATQIVDTDHVYYTSKIYGPGDSPKYLWVNISQMEREEWKLLLFLPSTHTQTKRVNLSFSFPFYGHLLKEITIATGAAKELSGCFQEYFDHLSLAINSKAFSLDGLFTITQHLIAPSVSNSGFIYTGDVIHQMLTATQYIAPLMANFDPSLSKNSTVLYYDNGTALVVQWNRVHLQDNINLGAFSFQASLHSDGRIVFVYKEIPVAVNDIISDNHPVKVGLADAFVVLHDIKQIQNVRRRTIYEYHRVNILQSKISSCTTVEILPLPTCLQFSSCGQCVTSQIAFNCSWCSRLQRCSSGFDRNRQEWVDFGCPEFNCSGFVLLKRRDPRCLTMTNVKNRTSHQTKHVSLPLTSTSKQQRTLNMTPTPFSKTSTTNKLSSPSRADYISQSSEKRPTNTSADDENTDNVEDSGKEMTGGLLAVVITLMIVLLTAILLTIYMYNHPTSSASLFLLERRPTRWPILKFRRGSSRPSYAEVETPGHDREVIIDLKQSFVISDRRESEQKEGFIVPDQRERFLTSESS